MSAQQRALLPILFIGFITSFSMSTILPFLPQLVQDFRGSDFTLGDTGLLFGILGASYALFEMIGAPILGGWSDRIGRKKVLLISHFGSFVAWGIFAYAFYVDLDSDVAFTLPRFLSSSDGTPILVSLSLPLTVVLGARVLDGLTGGNVAVANSYLADITPEENSSDNFGKMAAASGLGFIVGPALAGILSGTSMGYVLPVFVAMGITAIGLVALAIMPDAEKVRSELGLKLEDCHGEQERKKRKIKLGQALKIQYIPIILALYFLVYFAFNLFYTAFPVHAEQSLEWDPARIGYYFSALSSLMIVVQLFVLPRVSKKFKPVTLIVVGLLILSLYFYFAIASNIYILFFALIFFAVGNGTMWPSFLGLMSRIAGPDIQGAIQGFGSSAGAAASVLGLLMGGLLYDWIGAETFLFTGIGLTIVAIGSLYLRTAKQNNIPEKSGELE